jgi:hypothetical protein
MRLLESEAEEAVTSFGQGKPRRCELPATVEALNLLALGETAARLPSPRLLGIPGLNFGASPNKARSALVGHDRCGESRLLLLTQ